MFFSYRNLFLHLLVRRCLLWWYFADETRTRSTYSEENFQKRMRRFVVGGRWHGPQMENYTKASLNRAVAIVHSGFVKFHRMTRHFTPSSTRSGQKQKPKLQKINILRLSWSSCSRHSIVWCRLQLSASHSHILCRQRVKKASRVHCVQQ